MNGSFESAEIDDKHTSAKLSIDKKIYSQSAVLRACYWFTRDLHFQVEDGVNNLTVTVRVRVSNPTLAEPRFKSIDEWLPDLWNAFLDAQLRAEIQAETAPIRELIIAKAFAEAGVLEDFPPGSFEDPVGAGRDEEERLIQINANIPK
jgi:His-Xaa-Ser system protein HxsD